MFLKQFVGKQTWPFLIGIAATHLLAVLVKDTAFALPALVVLGLGMMWLAWKDLPLALAIVFIELFIGGHGHLIHGELFGFSVSLRMVLFGALMLVWLVRVLKKDIRPSFVAFRDAPWLVLALAILLGTMIGFLQNDPRAAFDDMNGYLTAAYLLPLISVSWTQTRKRVLLQALFASAAWLVFLTLILSYVFTHVDGDTLNHVYRFVRDQRLAEVTLQTISNDAGQVVQPYAARLFGADGYYYRVFMQSHFAVTVMLLVTWASMLVLWRQQRLPEVVAGSFAALASVVILSLSRSFFLGALVAAVWILFLSLRVGKKPLRNVLKRTALGAALVVLGLGLAWLTAALPVPPQPDISDAAFYTTSADTDREVALSSRWELLGPLMDAIWAAPVAGAGFGAEVTYITDDPRIRAQNPNGEYTTYRFEWGWQDIWLKMGVFGLVAFVWYYVALLQAMHVTVKRHGHKWLIIGLSGGLIMLAVAHVFSPYLNHPIGLGYMLFILPFVDFDVMKEKSKKKFESLTLKKPLKQAMGVAQQVKEEG